MPSPPSDNSPGGRLSPVRPPVRPPAAPTVPELVPPVISAPAPDEIAWGHVAHNTVGPSAIRLTESLPRVIRMLEPRVLYTAPECLVPLGLCFWEQHPTDQKRLEMTGPGDPRQARSLEQLGRDMQLRATNGLIEPTDPLLVDLNEVVDRLLAVAATLHTHGWGVGFLTPANVLFWGQPGARTLALVDLGFQWGPDRRPPQPGFLRTPGPFAALWAPMSLEEQHRAAPVAGIDQPLAPERQRHEVRGLGRLIASVLMGGRPFRAEGEERSRDPAPGEWAVPTELPDPPQAQGTRACVWHHLGEAMAGRIGQVEALRAFLREHPPSLAFRPPPGQNRARRPLLPPVAVVAALAGLLVAASYLPSPPTPDPPPGPPPPVQIQTTWRQPPQGLPADHPYLGLIRQAEQTADPSAIILTLLATYEVEPSREGPNRARERHARDYLRGLWVRGADRVIDKAVQDLDDPVEYPMALFTLKRLSQHLDTLGQLETEDGELKREEQRCRDRLRRELQRLPS